MSDAGSGIETVATFDPERIRRLIDEARGAGHRFLDRLSEEWLAGINRFCKPGEALFLLTAPPAVIAVCGVNIDPYSADPGVARLRHLYVLAAWRRHGFGSRLVRHATEHAAFHSFRRMRLRTASPSAAVFYETLGFRPCVDPSATHERLLGKP